MKKTSGRAFYLSIAVIAICVTCVSLWSIAQNLLPNVKSILGSTVSTSVMAQGEDLQSKAITGASSALDMHGTQSSFAGGANAAQETLKNIHVIADGAGVTAKDVARVQSVLNKAKSPTLIQDMFHVALKQRVSIELVNNAAEYEQALRTVGVSPTDAASMSNTTGGFTLNSTIIIPLNQNQKNTDLANTLTHELTHAFMNQNVGTLPSWINEGIAVYMGMQGQQRFESAINFGGDQRQLAEDILGVVGSHNLQPLSGNENVILSGKTPYDYELQDWLAISYLIAHDGVQSVNRYLQMMGQHAQESQAFVDAFGEKEDVFNQQFTAWLQSEASMADDGVQLTFSIHPSYHGQIGLLQHGESKWSAVQAASGKYQVNVSESGVVSGDLPQVKSTVSSSATDGHTMYVSLLPSSPLKYNGHRVIDCGFAFDVHNGLYAFQNAWITLDNGNTVYKSSPSLFGVSIVSAEELNPSNALPSIFSSALSQ